jgi:hypothetical protein
MTFEAWLKKVEEIEPRYDEWYGFLIQAYEMGRRDEKEKDKED